MKKILLASATVALLLAGSACSNNYDLYPDEMAKVLMIKDSGTRSVTVYSAQDKVPVTLTVLKGGVSPEQPSTATVRAMTQAEFDEYAAESGLAYSFLPSNCYSIGDGSATSVTFNGGEGYQNVTVDLDVKAIGAYLEANPGLVLAPAVPLVLEATDGSKVSDTDHMLFLVPDYRIPTIGFVETEPVLLNGETSYTFDLGLPFESQWDIECKVEVDADALAELNDAYGTSYGLMPSNAYSGVGSVTLNVGEQTTQLTINIDNAKAGFRTALPLRITALSLDGFVLENASALLAVDNAASYKLALTADMLYTNDVVAGDGGGLPSLIDGNLGNWFHSSWASFVRDDTFGSYVGYKLKSPVQSVGFDVTTRPNNSAGIPTRVELYALDSNGNWQLFANSSSFGKVLTAGSQTGSFGSFQCDFPFTEFRFCVKESKNGVLMGTSAAYWNAAEIVVYGK